MEYIHIKKWEKTQHYKYRNAPWIRLYTDIIDKYDEDGIPKKFRKLSETDQLTFLLLLCLAHKYNNNIPYENNKWLRQQIGIKRINLQSLIDAEYIYINGSAGNNAIKVDSKSASKTTSKKVSTVTDTGTATESNEGFALLDQETINESSIIQIRKYINKISEDLYQSGIFPDVHSFKNTMLKKGRNPRAILHALIRCFIKKPAADQVWGYCEQILKVESGNYYEQDGRKNN